MSSSEGSDHPKVMLYPRQKGTFSSSSGTSSLPASEMHAQTNLAALRQAVTLDRDAIAQFFHMPIHDAARHLNICVTSLKKVCRRLGYDRWPYVKPSKVARGGIAAPRLATSTTPQDVTKSVHVSDASVHFSYSALQNWVNTTAQSTSFTANTQQHVQNFEQNLTASNSQSTFFTPNAQQPAQQCQQHFKPDYTGWSAASHRTACASDWNVAWNNTVLANQTSFTQELPAPDAYQQHEDGGQHQMCHSSFAQETRVQSAHPKQEAGGNNPRNDYGPDGVDTQFIRDFMGNKDFL